MTFEEALNMIFTSQEHITYFSIMLLLTSIPLVMLVYGGLNLLLNIKSKNRAFGYTAFSLWILGLILAIAGGAGAAENFSEEASVRENMFLAPSNHDTLFLQVNDDKNLYRKISRKRGLIRIRKKILL
jgi:hypothetical protein